LLSWSRHSAATASSRENITKLLAENVNLKKELETPNTKLARMEKASCDKVMSKRRKEFFGPTIIKNENNNNHYVPPNFLKNLAFIKRRLSKTVLW
jgi:hypothetical protein